MNGAVTELFLNTEPVLSYVAEFCYVLRSTVILGSLGELGRFGPRGRVRVSRLVWPGFLEADVSLSERCLGLVCSGGLLVEPRRNWR